MPAEGAIFSLLVGGEGQMSQGAQGGSVGPSGMGVGMQNQGDVDEALRSATAGFDEDIRQRVERLADENDSDGLRKVVSDWSKVAEDLDGYEDGFDDEEDVVDWAVGEMTAGVELDEQDEKKLREAVAEEYADAVLEFRNHVAGDKNLERALRMSTRKDAVRRLEGIADCFRRLSGRRPYAVYELTDDGLIPGHEDAFDEPETAAEHYEKAVEENPDDAEAHNNYAVLLHTRLGETETAVEHYRRAIELYPRLAEARYSYGVLLLNDGKTEEAKEHLETSVSIWMDREEFRGAVHAMRRLVEACLKTGDEDAIVEYTESALKILNTVPENAVDNSDEERRWFGTVRMLTRSEDVKTQDLHGSALLNVEAEKTEEAVELFEKAWERHERHEKESEIGEYRASVAAGVALAAYLVAYDDLETSWTANEVTARVEADDLHEAPRAVYDRIADTGDGSDSEDLRRLSEEYEKDDQSLAATEARAFASLLEKIEGRAK
ncbi:MAG: tetratricopeptide repeat protein [Halobacteriales archaeon]|nr:tetratricopeptide repeat protein [Halobacteriales archaeon]